MKPTLALAFVALLGLCACDQVRNDPDIQEARTAVKGALNDDGAALKQVYNEARATREDDRDTNEVEDKN